MSNPAPTKRVAAKEFRMTISHNGKSVDVGLASVTNLKHQIAQMEVGEILVITRLRQCE